MTAGPPGNERTTTATSPREGRRPHRDLPHRSGAHVEESARLQLMTSGSLEPSVQPRRLLSEPASLRRLVSIALLVLLLALVGQAVSELASASMAFDIRVGLPGLSAERVPQVRISAVTPLGYERELSCHVGADGLGDWRLERVWARSLRLQLPAASVDSFEAVVVVVGPASYRFDRAGFSKIWRKVDRPTETRLAPVGELVTYESPPSQTKAYWSPLRIVLNWPGTEAGLAGMVGEASRPFVLATGLFALMLAVRWMLARPRWERWLRIALGDALDESQPDPPVSRRSELAWLSLGLAVLVLVLVRIHSEDPYWFTQDDNRVQFLPDILFACRSLFSGQIPTFNPHQFLGFPLIDPGRYPFTYPLTYACYAFARWPLGNECLTLEVWAALHLFLGFLATYLLARVAGQRPALACSVALSFVLCGFFFILGRAWPGASALALWLPLTLLPLELMRRGWRGSTLLLAAAIGFSYHIAHVQFWAYTLILVGSGLAILWCSPRTDREQVLWAVPAGLLGLALALPVLWLQVGYSAQLQRAGIASWGILPHCVRLVLPDWIAGLFQPATRWGHMLYSGTWLAGAGLLGLALLAGTVAVAGGWRRHLERNLWAALAVPALLLALGRDGPLWMPLSCLPGFSMLNHPVKLIGHVVLCLVVAGGVSIERLLRQFPQRRAGERILFVAVVAMLLVHASPSLPALREWRVPMPYPGLQPLLGSGRATGLVDGSARILPVAEAWNGEDDNLWALSFSLPSHYGLFSVDGYDPLIWASPENRRAIRCLIADPVAAARAYGVRWCLQRKSYRPPSVLRDLADADDMTTSKLDSPLLIEHIQRAGTLKAELPQVRVWELSTPDSLAFPAGHPDRSLPIRFRGDGGTVDVSTLGGGARVVVNVLMRPRIFTWVDGRPATAASDEWGRVVVDVPAGSTTLELRYCPAWESSLLLAVGLASLGLALAWALKHRPGVTPPRA